MSKKTEEIYDHILQYINNNLFEFNAISFKTDFEKAMRNSLRRNFPSAKVSGCWFHYCHALKRNAAKINMFTKKLKNNINARRLYKKFMILPLLPSESINDAFNLLKQETDEKIINFPEFTQFISYYERQWMKKVTTKHKYFFLMSIYFYFMI